MEQVIFLIVIYTIWGIAQAISKSKKKQRSSAKPGRKSPVPKQWQPKQGEAPPSKDPELPEFLRGLLEMAEQTGEVLEQPTPPPPPPPPPRPVPVSVKPVEIEVPEVEEFEYADDGKSAIKHTIFDELNDAFEAKKARRKRSDWKKQLRSPGRVRDAFILKELLDKPVSLRRRGFPFGGV